MANRSNEQLTKSIERRIKHLMIETLVSFENNFEDLQHDRDAEIFKNTIRNKFNDVIRAQRDELRDYDVDYRPLKSNADGSISMTKTLIDNLKSIEFISSKHPAIRFKASSKILSGIRDLINEGVIYTEKDESFLEVVGLNACIRVLFVIDNYPFRGEMRTKYRAWREELVIQYRSKE